MFTRRREQLLKSAAAREAAGGPADEDWDNVVLLLNQQNVDAKQNQSFDDESTSNHTITAVGDATQGTFSPFSPNGWSLYKDTSGFLSVTHDASLDVSSSEFTFEFWVFPTEDYKLGDGLLSKRLNGGVASGVLVYFASVGLTPSLLVSFNGSTWSVNSASTESLVLGEWNHVAVCRSGDDFLLFINGVEGVNQTRVGVTVHASSANLVLGAYANIGGICDPSFFSDFRVVIGSTVYTTDFTPPTAPLTAVTNTQLLTLQDNRLIDNSGQDQTVAFSGSNCALVPHSPFPSTVPWSAATHGGSLYGDGTGDWASVATSSDFAFGGTGEFGIQFWVYPTVTPTNYDCPLSRWDTSNDDAWLFFLFADGRVQFWVYDFNSGAAFLSSGAGALITDAWNHINVSRLGATSWELHVNGVRVATASNDLTITDANSQTVKIGTQGLVTTRAFVGYISGLQIDSGGAIFSGATITLPTSPPTVSGNTVLLCNFTNAGIYDASAKHNITLTGNTQTDTGVVKFAGASIELDGTSDTAATTATELLGLGPAYTVEFWVYLDTLRNEARFFRYISGGVTYGAIEAGGGAGGSNTDFRIAQFGSGERLTAFGALSTGTWIHVAVTYDGTTSTLWMNGTSADTYIGNVFPGASAQIILGDANSIDGRIEDFRVTAGVQRYTAAFTPPGNSFPIRGA